KAIDIVLAIDASGSMIATDFKPNRFEAAKKVLLEFVDKMEGNRMGLVVFGQIAFTQCPLTLDKEIVKELIDVASMESIKNPMLRNTAIGNAIIVSLNRFNHDKKENKVIILLTDGMNNRGIDPIKAAAIARRLKVKIYTIGIGTPEGDVLQSGIRTSIDEDTLKDIALITNGKYFHAQDPKALSEIYDRISKMEKQKIDEYKITKFRERFSILLWSGIILLFISIIIRKFLFAGV
ncbi:MAG: VWA domain-containing protein, partial [bacterium]|nr:VWA domain-containing protein [bacterium]